MSETSKNNVVRTRIAPSPTGEYHIGHLRTCLYDYALARQNNGQFVIRIEDTDQKRYVEGAADRILQVIKDYGLSWDEGPDVGGPYAPYVQTQRLDIYKPYVQKLIDDGHAYYCFCTQERLDDLRATQKAAGRLPKYDRHCLNLSKEDIQKNLDNHLPYVVRLRVPDNETLVFNDAIRGQIKFNTNDIDDQVLVKSNGIPTYHLAVVIDDHLMNISHVFRGEEWITSTPKQILLYRYLGWVMPVFAHLTVLMDPDGKGKMSKRHGSVSARSFLDDGYLPEAVLNFLMLLGWNPGTDQEIFSLDEFVKEFSLNKLHKKSPAFDRKKLDYFNGVYLRQKSDDELAVLFKKFLPQADDRQIGELVPLLKERIAKLSDLVPQTRFLFEDVAYDKELLLSRGTSPDLAAAMLSKTKELLSSVTDFTFTNIQSQIMDLVKNNSWNTGEFFMVFRVAVAGSKFTPPIVESLPILGKENTLHKLDIALNKLS
ncbi:MAG TPA: glutamate--tRNA ligase [Patescibacteria group bacterium]